MTDRALGHIARHWRRAVDRVPADPVGEDIDEIGDVGRWLFDQGAGSLPAHERLGDGRGERHHLDAEAGVDGPDPVAEQSGQALSVGNRLGRADADGPERVFGEWWKRDAELVAVRDYFRVEDEAGERYWIYRAGDGEDAETGSHRWFLHGVFG